MGGSRAGDAQSCHRQAGMDFGTWGRLGRDPQRFHPEYAPRRATHPRGRCPALGSNTWWAREGHAPCPGSSPAPRKERGHEARRGRRGGATCSQARGSQAQSQPELRAGLIIPRLTTTPPVHMAPHQHTYNPAGTGQARGAWPADRPPETLSGGPLLTPTWALPPWTLTGTITS